MRFYFLAFSLLTLLFFTQCNKENDEPIETNQLGDMGEVKINNYSNLELFWDYIDYAETFHIYRSTDSDDDFTEIGKTSKTNFIDSSYIGGHTYYYKVRASNQAGFSTYSPIVSIEMLKEATLITKFGEAGNDFGEFALPHPSGNTGWNICIIDDLLYVADAENNRIQRINNGEFNFKDWLGYKDGVWGVYTEDVPADDRSELFSIIYKNNSIYVSSYIKKTNKILKLNKKGEIEKEIVFNHPLWDETDFNVDSNENIFIYDEKKIYKYDIEGNLISSFGDYGSDEGEFNSWVCKIVIDKDDNVFVCDGVNNRVNKFSNEGIFIMSFPIEYDAVRSYLFYDGTYLYTPGENEKGLMKYSTEGEIVDKWGTDMNLYAQFIVSGHVLFAEKYNEIEVYSLKQKDEGTIY